MPGPRAADVGELLRQLADAGVEFIVVKDRLMLPVFVALAEKLSGSD